jgi:retron-type reverse transcriptase
MRRTGGHFERIIDPENLRVAYMRARRGKRDRHSVRRFELDLHDNLALLHRRLAEGTFASHGYRLFTIQEPKPRRIAAPAFADRVVHHAILLVLEPEFERIADFDSYACRVGKGLHLAVLRAQQLCRRHSWFLQLDVRKFFESIDHAVLFSLLERRFKDVRLLALLRAILDSYCVQPGKGIPIGSLTSQHLANFVLWPLDQFVRQDVRAKGYVRYMDDFVVFGDAKEQMLDARARIEAFLRDRLQLALKNAGSLDRTEHGVGFLGIRVRASHLALMGKTKRRVRRKLRSLVDAHQLGIVGSAALAVRTTALLARTHHVKARGLRAAWIAQFADQDA